MYNNEFSVDLLNCIQPRRHQMPDNQTSKNYQFTSSFATELAFQKLCLF